MPADPESGAPPVLGTPAMIGVDRRAMARNSARSLDER
jgi:predicted thioesterase